MKEVKIGRKKGNLEKIDKEGENIGKESCY